MPRFSCLFLVEASRRIDAEHPVSIQRPAGWVEEIKLRPNLGRDAASGLLIDRGILVEVRLEADTMQAAHAAALDEANLAIVALAVSNPGRYEMPEPRCAMQVSGPPPLTFVETYEMPLPSTPAQIADLDRFNEVLGALLTRAHELDIWRIHHSGHWFSQALLARDRLARIPVAYTGLEVLDEPLEAAGFSITGAGQSRGVSGWLDSRSAGFEEKARRLRRDIVHGKLRLGELHDRADVVDHGLLTALRGAFYKLAGIPEPPWTPEALDSPNARRILRVTLEGRAWPNPAGEVGAAGTLYPTFGAQFSLRDAHPDDAGRQVIRIAINRDPAAAPGARLVLDEVVIERTSDLIVEVERS